MAIITISRGAFSGGQNIAERVARRLGYRCVSRESLVETARLYGIFEEVFKAFQASTGAPIGLEHLNTERKRYLASLRAALINIARNDYLVYHGYAGHFLLKGIPNIIKVRINASMKFRTDELIEREHVSREEAVNQILREDEERVKWIRFLYHMEWDDPALYDIVINLDPMSVPIACDLLCQLANFEVYKVTAESRNIIDNLALSSYLKSIIANTKNISGGEDLEIEADAGVVTIKGTLRSLADVERVKMIMMKTPGIQNVIPQIQVSPLAMIKID